MKKLLVVLIAVLSFSSITPSYAQYILNWSFDSLSSGMTNTEAYVLSLAMKDSAKISDLYAGGHFKVAGRDSASNVAEWNRTSWSGLGTGTNNDVCALAMYGSKLYVGGKFDTAGGIASSHIACWDTAAMKWDSLSGTLNGNVYALCLYNNILYVGGDFTIADGDTVNHIAMWNGTVWSGVGKGVDNTVYSLAVSNDTLYAGGSFLKSNGLVVNHIAKWNSTYWDSVGGGTNNTIYALADDESLGALFIGGAFTKSENITTRYISQFNNYNSPQQWSPISGGGTNDTVRALNASRVPIPIPPISKSKLGLGGGDVLVVGGNFDSAGSYRCPHIAAINISSWNTIGGFTGPVFALTHPFNILDSNNYVGGRFDSALNITSEVSVNNIAQLFISDPGEGIATINNNSDIAIYPNPSNGLFTMEVKSEELMGKSMIEVYNVLGEQVYSIHLPQTPKGALNKINISDQPSGVYFYRVVDENSNLIGEGKLVIQR